jgi:superfamily II DNA or RNA helicase
MEEGTNPEKEYENKSEREHILELFANGTYQVLVAMKCLDEGVDIPPARKAILMASSGNPREYIQRIGRLIRRYHDKEEAEIYDIIVAPKIEQNDNDLKTIEMRILDKEMKRYEEIAKIAINSTEALNKIYSYLNKIYMKKG